MSEQTKEQSVWHDKDDTLESKVYQAIGAGSMCWSETPKGVFDSDNAKKPETEASTETPDTPTEAPSEGGDASPEGVEPATSVESWKSPP